VIIERFGIGGRFFQNYTYMMQMDTYENSLVFKARYDLLSPNHASDLENLLRHAIAKMEEKSIATGLCKVDFSNSTCRFVNFCSHCNGRVVSVS